MIEKARELRKSHEVKSKKILYHNLIEGRSPKVGRNKGGFWRVYRGGPLTPTTKGFTQRANAWETKKKL